MLMNLTPFFVFAMATTLTSCAKIGRFEESRMIGARLKYLDIKAEMDELANEEDIFFEAFEALPDEQSDEQNAQEHFEDANQSFDEGKVCGNFPVSKMQSDEYYSLRRGETEQLLISKKLVGKGSFGKVQIGFAQVDPEMPVRQCVAIKFSDISDGTKMFKHAMAVIKEIQKLPKQHRRHIVETFDFGYVVEKNDTHDTPQHAMIVMEQGTESLFDRLYREHKNFANENELKQAVRQIVEPIIEIHQVAMHLDVKPQNYMFVRDEDGTELLKLIDFDGAELIPKFGPWYWRRKLASGERANFRRRQTINLGTVTYCAPERDLGHVLQSSKSDIWAIGIMIYQIVLVQSSNTRHYKQKGGQKLIDKVWMELCSIGALYHGYDYGDFNQVEKIDFEAPKWTNVYDSAILNILRLWTSYPAIAALATNAMTMDWTKRMTGQGILVFLEGGCYPAEFDLQDGNEIKIFNAISFTQLEAIFEQKAKVLKDSKKWKRMAKMVADAKKARQKMVEQIKAATQQVCDVGKVAKK